MNLRRRFQALPLAARVMLWALVLLLGLYMASRIVLLAVLLLGG